jgi:hypothetical protein
MSGAGVGSPTGEGDAINPAAAIPADAARSERPHLEREPAEVQAAPAEDETGDALTLLEDPAEQACWGDGRAAALPDGDLQSVLDARRQVQLGRTGEGADPARRVRAPSASPPVPWTRRLLCGAIHGVRTER